MRAPGAHHGAGHGTAAVDQHAGQRVNAHRAPCSRPLPLACHGGPSARQVLGNSDDDAVPPSHTQRLFDAIARKDKELHIVKARSACGRGAARGRALQITADASYIVAAYPGRPLGIQGANHYYAGQPDRVAEACRIVIDWLNRKGLQVPPLPLSETVAARL